MMQYPKKTQAKHFPTTKRTKSSKAVLLLPKKKRNGEVAMSENAELVWEYDFVFMKHKLDKFKPKFKSMNAEEEQNDGII